MTMSGEVSVRMAAPPEKVWALVSDVTRIGEFSPETFEVLIDYLTDDVPAIRHLAAWHLVRAVPGGRAVGFKPGGTKAECEAAAAEWRRRVPPGQLPTPEKK